jgi:hypothetical protein
MSPLSEERRSQLLTNLAKTAQRYGLRSPAIWFLAMHEPLSFLIGQMLFVSQPALAPFVGDTILHDYALLFEEKENVKRLLDLLASDRVELSAPLG